MTMPVVLPGVATDPATAVAPNVSTSQSEQDGQAAVFGAVLAQVLAHVATTSQPEPTATSNQPAAESPATIDDTSNSPNSHGVRRGLDLVAPEFRERLERVIDRMESEFGYKVEVSETYRSQARQNALFAQGRTEPGQVVTWTRASNHTAGRAADLVIDGTYANPLAYERLMRIAQEEGLRTLGARDPGHVELPATRPVIAQASPSIASQASIVSSAAKLESALDKLPNAAQPQMPRGVATPDASARVATVARVAAVPPVAQVAGVAQVATVAMVGAQAAPVVHGAAIHARSAPARDAADGRPAPAVDATTLASPVTTSPAVTSISSTATMSSGGENTSESDPHSREPNVASKRARLAPAAGESAAEVLRQSRDELLRAVANIDPTATSSNSAASVDKSAVVGHTDMSERIARLLKVQDAAGERPLSQVLLRLERPDGGEDRLRVDLRGSTVSATLDVGDQAAADRLGANVKELQRALERHGFEADSLTVRSSSRSLESSTLARAAGATVESELQRASASSPNTSSHTSSRERGARHDEQRPSPDSQRHRSRREQKGGPQ